MKITKSDIKDLEMSISGLMEMFEDGDMKEVEFIINSIESTIRQIKESK